MRCSRTHFVAYYRLFPWSSSTTLSITLHKPLLYSVACELVVLFVERTQVVDDVSSLGVELRYKLH